MEESNIGSAYLPIVNVAAIVSLHREKSKEKEVKLETKSVEVRPSPGERKRGLFLLSSARSAAIQARQSPAVSSRSLLHSHTTTSTETEDRKHNQALAIGLMEKERLERMNEIATEKHEAIEEEALERRRSGDLVHLLEEQARKEAIRDYEAMLEMRQNRRSSGAGNLFQQLQATNRLVAGF
jgi:hypothetical protein